MGKSHDASMLSERPDAVRRGRGSGDYRYVALPQWALLMPGLSDVALRVYALLLAHVNAADDDPVAWPQQQTLAAMLGCHRNTISRAIRELSAAGLVEVAVERYGPNRCRKRNVYTVHTIPPDDLRVPTSVAEWYAEQPRPEPALTNRRARKSAGHPGRTKNGASGRTISSASGRTTRGAGTKQKGNYLKGENPPTPRADADGPRPPRPAWCGECDTRTRHRTEVGDDGRERTRRCPRCHPLAVGSASNVTEVASNVTEVASNVTEVSGDHTPPAAVTIAEIRNVLAMQRQRSPRSPRYRTERAQTHADARSAGS